MITSESVMAQILSSANPPDDTATASVARGPLTAAGESTATAVATDGVSRVEREGVSIVIPCRNGERFITKLLENLARQCDGLESEIIVVDGMSEDRTCEEVHKFIDAQPQARVRLIENPSRTIPAALNRGIAAAAYGVILRMDVHSVPSENYVSRCLEALASSGAAVVGMPIRVQPRSQTLVARAIALAVAHPFGIGNAAYRNRNAAAQDVDTVPFGAFRRELWLELGGFDESLLTNEDYDFFFRARRRGGRILLDSSASSDYYARGTLGELAAQYSRYGRWKAQMIKRHPHSIRARQMVAPLFVTSLCLLSALSIWSQLAFLFLALETAVYGAMAAFFATRVASKAGELRLALPVAAAFLVIHCSWGASFLAGLVSAPRSRDRDNKQHISASVKG